MKTFPALYTTEFTKQNVISAYLFKLSLSTPRYWTSFDQDIYFDSRWWTRKNIKFDSAQLSIDAKVDSITIEIENIDKAISDILLAEDIAGKDIRIYHVFLDKLTIAPIGATTESNATKIFVGWLDRTEVDRRRARIRCYNHFILWQKLTPRRKYDVNCQWVFKGTECAYAGGETWCDRTWDRCVALSNKLNYGGFRHLGYLSGKEIMWGKTSKSFGR